MDPKARLAFTTPAIAEVLVFLYGYQLNDSSKSNLVLAIYGMSKVASCRDYLLSSHLQMDRILIQLSGSDSAKIKANVNRAYKNLHSDVNEAIEEGAVATLIAMSLEVSLFPFLFFSVLMLSSDSLFFFSLSPAVIIGKTKESIK
jgi:hypothetical protein